MVGMYRCQRCKVVKDIREMKLPNMKFCLSCSRGTTSPSWKATRKLKRDSVRQLGHRCSVCGEYVTEQKGTAHIVPTPAGEEMAEEMSRHDIYALEDKAGLFELLCRYHFLKWSDDLAEGKR